MRTAAISYELYDKEDFDRVARADATAYIREHPEEENALKLYHAFMSENSYDYQLNITGLDADEEETAFEEISAIQREDMLEKFYGPFLEIFNKVHCATVMDNE